MLVSEIEMYQLSEEIEFEEQYQAAKEYILNKEK